MKDLLILSSFFSGLVVTSALMTVFYVESSGRFRSPQEETRQLASYAGHGSLSAAYNVCNDNILDNYDASLRSKTYDDLSSRYDSNRGVFLVFADISVGKNMTDSQPLRVICTVDGDNHLVSLKSISPDGSPNRRYTAAFGRNR